MKNEKVKIKNLVVISAIVLGGLVLAGTLWAGKTTAQAISPNQSVVGKLVERFNLNKDEVTGVFDEVWEERQQKMQAYMESRLDEAVKDGVITAEQKEAFLKKQAEWQEKQRQLREEMRKWMEESGIDFEKLAPYRIGFGGPRGFGKGGHFGGF